MILMVVGCALADLVGESSSVGPLDWRSCEVMCGNLPTEPSDDEIARDTCVSWCFFAQTDPVCGEAWDLIASCHAAEASGWECPSDEELIEQLGFELDVYDASYDPDWSILGQACYGAPPHWWTELGHEEAT